MLLSTFLHCYPVMGWSINRLEQLSALLTRKQSELEGPKASPSAPDYYSPLSRHCRYSSGHMVCLNSIRNFERIRPTKLNKKYTETDIQIVPGRPPFCIQF